ncbi:MAG TPA: hypothetical protein VI564_08305 [Candidatus Nanoarchaeia archaeon]|nr:hypothetical protein [Candidatus Nanoarchaeia archaeon]
MGNTVRSRITRALVVDKEYKTKGSSLDKVVEELGLTRPRLAIFRAHNYGDAVEIINERGPSIVLIDQSVEDSYELCKLIKSNAQLGLTRTAYFVGSLKSIDKESPYVDKWYHKKQNPEDVARDLSNIIDIV